MTYSEIRLAKRLIATAGMKCYCGSTDIWRAGFDVTPEGRRQRYQCKKCGRYLFKNKEG
ncbi:MAG: hypothetical protein ABSB28_12000 [Candidatus Bathyarchaeia archaeon]